MQHASILRLIPLLLALVLAALPATSGADPPTPSLDIPTESFELDNGLRVVLSENHASPTVAIAVYYDVGSRNEVRGRSGFAHLFEHMMFEGSANVGKGEHFRHISSNGGRMNGTTSEDRTVYFEILPSDRLELGLWLESDRMLSLNVDAENFENQREVVKEERRLRVDNQPYVPAWLDFMEMAYESWEYSHSVIGDMEDLDAAELADVQAFFDLYYAPNNAVLALAGDFDPGSARALVERYFREIPPGPAPPVVEVREPQQLEQRQQTYDDSIATQPAVIMGWHVPPEPDPDHDALRVLSQILGGGEASRLYDRLVRREGAALNASAYLQGHRGPDLLLVDATSQGPAPEVLRDMILEEVARLRESGVSLEELEAAQQQLIRRTVISVESNLRRALVIGRDALYYGEPDRINGEIDRILAVTPEAVQRVLDRHLAPNRADIMLVRALGE